MSNVLLLVHRVPFPPDKGDKIRSYHLLKHLCSKHNVFLGAFIDDEHDWQYQAKVEALCESTCLIALNKKWSTLKSMLGLLNGNALTLPYYHNIKMQCWVSATIRKHEIKHVIVFSSSMAQYVQSEQLSDKNRIIDFVDVDSDKWRQYAEKKRWPFNWVYKRESKKSPKYERKIAAKFNVSAFVSQEEAALFKQLAPESSSKIKRKRPTIDLVVK